MNITDILHPDAVIADINSTTKSSVMEELAGVIEKVTGLPLKKSLITSLEEREKLGTTGIGNGIAIPHGKIKEVRQMTAAFGRSIKGVDFQSLDGKPAHIFFLLVAPEEMAGPHLKALQRISLLLREPSRRDALMRAKNKEEIYSIISEGEENLKQ